MAHDDTNIVKMAENSFKVYGNSELIATAPTLAEAEFWSQIYKAHLEEMMQTTMKSFYKKKNNHNIRMVVISAYANSALPVRYFCREYDAEGKISYNLYTQETIDRHFEPLTF